MSRDGGELLELPLDVCGCIQVAETHGPHLELNLQQEGKASLGSTPRANRAFMLPELPRGQLWPLDSVCHQSQTLITQGCILASMRQEGMS